MSFFFLPKTEYLASVFVSFSCKKKNNNKCIFFFFLRITTHEMSFSKIKQAKTVYVTVDCGFYAYVGWG